MAFCGGLVVVSGRRKAAVGRIELRILIMLYALSLPFYLLTQGSFLQQAWRHPASRAHRDSRGHRGGALLEPARNGIVATQVVENGSTSSIIPLAIAVAFFAATTYIAHDTTWHAAATAIYLPLMAHIVLGVLNEVRPMWFYVPSGVLFMLSRLDYFLSNKPICKGMNAKIDGSFVASLCETAALGVVYLAWRSITKEWWDDEYPVQEGGVGNPAFTQNRSPARDKSPRRNEDEGDPEVEMTNTKGRRRGLGYGLNDSCDATHAIR
ncbi:hypothetical protein FIBSPDRAFT_962783 [Athelia psychrophila]|uniref:Uncharacterized protein n=1 Tax=Athelia psychrophila TaxID=1759441 RepID=A0A165ZPN3_9AGAM|nr:hypothetical protein FIBSPDRAFT_962783 [Fibularhizoctonia sp. CBS 109695]